MAGPSVIEGNQAFKDNVSIAGTFTMPDETVTDAKVAAAAAIDVSKLDHRTCVTYQQPNEKLIVHDRKFLYKAKSAGTLSKVSFCVGSTIPVGSCTVSFNIRKSTAGGARADVLTEVVISAMAVSGSLTKTLPVAWVPRDAIIGTAAYIADDLFEICVWTLNSGSSSVGEGLVVEALFDEAA